MQHLKALGRVVYLQVDYEALSARLSDMRGRGVVLRDGQTLAELLEERQRLYQRYADVTVPEGALTLEEVVSAVCAACQ